MVVFVWFVEFVEIFIWLGVDLGCCDFYGNIFLYIVFYYGFDNIVVCLLKYVSGKKWKLIFI